MDQVRPNFHRWSGRALNAPSLALLIGVLLALPPGVAAPNSLEYSLSLDGRTLRLEVEANASFYYILKNSATLQDFHPVGLRLGQTGAAWRFDLPVQPSTAGFFSLEPGHWPPLNAPHLEKTSK